MAMMATKDQTSVVKASFLDVKAHRIKELSVKFATSSIDIGREFKQARAAFKHRSGRVAGNESEHPLVNADGEMWNDWCRTKTGWSASHAASFIKVAERFGNDKVLVAKTSHEVLRIMAQGTTPQSAVDEVRTRVLGGDPVSKREAMNIVRDHRAMLPSRKEAMEMARGTGRLITARDGRMYTGATEDEIAEYSGRRSTVFGIERAFNYIADCVTTPAQLMDMAEGHWIGEMSLGKLDAAIDYLTKLKPLLAKRQKVVS